MKYQENQNGFLTDISFRSLMGKVGQYREAVLQVLLLYLLWSVAELTIPFLTKLLVDQGIGYEDKNLIVIILLAQLLFFAGAISTDFFKAWILRHIGVRMNIRVINSYLFRVFNKDLLHFNAINEGKLLQHVNDNLRIEQFLTAGALSLLNAVFKLSLFCLILGIFNIQLGLIFFVSIILLLAWDVSFMKTQERIDTERFKFSSQIRKDLVEIVKGIFDIKVNALENQRRESWNQMQHQLAKLRLKMLGLSQYYKGGTIFISRVRDAFILFLSCYMVINGSMTLGALLAIQYILGQSNQPALDVMQFIKDYQDARLSLNRLQDMFTEDEDTQQRPTAIHFQPSPIHFDNVSFTYPNSTKGVDEIDLAIEVGDHIALIGESGSGKTTLLKLLLGLIPPDQGNIAVGNFSTQFILSEQWKSQCSVLTQEAFIFENTVLYNITFQTDLQQVDIMKLNRAIEICCFKTVLDGLSDGLQTIVGQNGKNLSKGQMQRLVLARAIYKDGAYLILDEATNSLDNRTANKVIRNLMEFQKDKTIILATHKLHLTANFHRIIVMDEGRITKHLVPEDIFNEQESFLKIYDKKTLGNE